MKKVLFLLVTAFFASNVHAARIGRVNITRLGIHGKGFLGVTLPNGDQAYSREIFVKTNEAGQLVTADDYLVTPAITLSTNCKTHVIDDTTDIGTIYCKRGALLTAEGKIGLFEFASPVGLKPLGAGFYFETKESGAAVPAANSDALMVGY